jgi:hypothetical protein
MNPLVTLGASELRALATAAADGRLNPATPGSVGRFVSDGPAVARALGELAATGAALASTLELLAEAAERRSSVEDLVELVLTGPNTGTGRDTGVVVRQLFREARTSVWVCGYKLYNARDLFADLARPDLRVRMLLDVGEAEGRAKKQRSDASWKTSGDGTGQKGGRCQRSGMTRCRCSRTGNTGPWRMQSASLPTGGGCLFLLRISPRLLRTETLRQVFWWTPQRWPRGWCSSSKG